jgi:hypothetical protein
MKGRGLKKFLQLQFGLHSSARNKEVDPSRALQLETRVTWRRFFCMPTFSPRKIKFRGIFMGNNAVEFDFPRKKSYEI